MPNKYDVFVSSLSEDDFVLLNEAIASRKNRQRYGVSNFEELALHYSRTPSCPGAEVKTTSLTAIRRIRRQGIASRNDRIIRHLVLTDVQYKRKPSK
ncbi:MAG: hypothetical protein K6A70_08645 [Erysipelotrichaceae bacterium]|nr:hypothetical protein [Erysipelotrichaceae bacterium]